jgi:autotransporter-associated beta strand protein
MKNASLGACFSKRAQEVGLFDLQNHKETTMKPTHRYLSAALALGAAAAIPATALAQSISVNFGADKATVGDAAKNSGAIPIAGDLWNNASGASDTLDNLIDSTGTATAANVTWAAPNIWQSGSTGATATSENGSLTKGYLDDGTGWTVELVSPYLLNDIYIIHATDQNDPANMSAVEVNGSFYKGDEAGATIPASGVGDSWQAVNWTDADTLVESDNYLKVSGQVAVSLAGYKSSPGRAAIAGVQVVNAYTGTLSYWDTNGATEGSGNLGGTWGSDNFWSSSADGDAATAAWKSGDTAVFSAGTDAIDSNTVTISGTQTADAVWVQEGEIVLDGGTLDLNGGLGLLRGDDLGLVVDSTVTAANLLTSGIVTLNNASNSITGLVTIGGIVTLGADHTFSQVTGSGVFDIGGNTLTVGGATDGTFAGDFEGDTTATVNKVGTGTTILGLPTNFAGTVTVSAGTLGFTGGTLDVTGFTGAGNFAKAGGGELTVISALGITGNIAIEGGVLTNGGGLNAISMPISTLNGVLRQTGGGTMTVSSTLGTDASVGAVDCRGDNLVYTSGAVAKFKDMRLRNGNQTVEAGADVTVRYMNIGDGGGTAGIFNQTGGMMTVESGSNGIRIGHWSGAGRELNVTGGTFDATDLVNNTGEARYINMGWDGEGDMTVGGGTGTATVKASGLRFDRNRPKDGSSASTATILANGIVEVGPLGTVGQGTNDGVVLSGGLIRGTANGTWAAQMEAAAATSSTIDVDSGVEVAQTGPLNGTGDIEKTGDGTLSLAGTAGTFTGAVSVSGGILQIDGDPIPTAASVTVASGGAIGGGTPEAPGTGTLATLDLAAGSSSVFRIGADSDQVVVSDADGLTVTASHTVSVRPVGEVLVGDMFPVIDYDGTIQGDGFGGLSLAPFPNPHYNLSLVDNTADTTVDVEITSITHLFWTGPGSWNLVNNNWNNGTGADKFYSSDIANFDDLAAATENVVVDDNSGADPIEPAAMIFNNTTATEYTLSGAPVSGNGSLTKTDDGTLIITNDNTYTGATDIQAGTLQIGNGGTTGSVVGDIAVNAGSLDFRRSDAFSVTAIGGQTISGDGAVSFDGAGTGIMTLAGRNTWTGGLTIDNGTVILSGGGWYKNPSQGKGTMTVNATGIAVNWSAHSYGGQNNPAQDMVLNGGTFQVRSETYVRDITMIAGTVELYPGSSNKEIRSAANGSTDIIVEDAATSSEISSKYNCVGASRMTVNDPDTDFLVSGVIFSAAPLTKNGVGNLLASAANTHTGNLNIEEGSLTLGAGGSFSSSSQIAVAAGAIFDVTAVSPYGIPAAQTLAGNGTVDGSVDVDGSVSPGASAGTLTVTGAVTFGESSIYNWEVSDWTGAAGTGYDTMVAGSLDFASTALNRFTVVITEDALVNFSDVNASFTIVSTTGGITNFDPAIVVVDDTAFTGTGTWQLVVSGNDLVLEYTGAGTSDYDTWTGSYGLTGADAAPTADPDNDGVDNAAEYAFGLDPTSGASVSPITSGPTAAGEFTYTRRDPAITGLGYTIETSTDMANWTPDTGAAQTVVGTVDDVQTVNVTVTAAPVGGKLFVRAVAD